MTGYEWRPAFRMTPENGAVEMVRLCEALTDLGGPVSVQIRYVAVIRMREDVNRDLRPHRLGFRVEVDMDCTVRTMEDSGWLTTIAGWLMDRTKVVELSLDDEVTWREVVLRKWEGPRAVAGKTFAGASYGLDVSCKTLIEAPPDISSGSGTGVW